MNSYEYFAWENTHLDQHTLRPTNTHLDQLVKHYLVAVQVEIFQM